MTMVISGSDGVTFPDSTTQNTTDRYGFVNRIINGDMRIDQRNAGAAVSISTTSDVYTLDRWAAAGQSADGVFSVQQDTSAPASFTNSLKVTVTTADASIGSSQYYLMQQSVEGFNIADWGWGTANAKTVTLSFWVRSSLTGTFGGSLRGSFSTSVRSYPFTYTISAADTWEQKTITIVGDTSGTWATNNSTGVRISFSIGDGSDRLGSAGTWATANYSGATGQTNLIGTLNATWFITGVQLEVGSVATPFERRPFGAELSLCQRYYYKLSSNDGIFGVGYNSSTTASQVITFFPTRMRTAPTALEQSGTANHYRVRHLATLTDCSSVPTFFVATDCTAWSTATVASGLTAGQGSFLRSNSASAYLAWSAEL
jgi:hypothetical protein